MIRKILSNWLPIALGVVVVISLILSGLIWTNPAHYGKSSGGDSGSSSQLTNKSIGDVYLPTQVVRTAKNGNKQLLYAQKNNLPLSLKQAISKWTLGHSTRVSTNNKRRYMKYINQSNTLMMNYPDNISTNIFNETFKQSINVKRVKRFSRIIIPLDSTTHVYLLDDKNYNVYRVAIKKQTQLTKIKQMLTSGVQRLNVQLSDLNGNVMLTFPEKISMPTYSYLLNKQTGNSFITTLMGTSNSSASVSQHKSGQTTTYTDGSSQRMVINNKSGRVTYENFDSDDKDYSTQNALLSSSFTQLTEIGVPLENIRYDSSKLSSKSVTYRGYVESFPIFNQTEYGAVHIKYNGDQGQKYTFSLYSLQVPVPNDNQKVELPSTADMLKQLSAVGIKSSQIKRIRLGYAWGTSVDDNKMIELKPSYFVYYKGSWLTYTDLIQQNS